MAPAFSTSDYHEESDGEAHMHHFQLDQYDHPFVAKYTLIRGTCGQTSLDPFVPNKPSQGFLLRLLATIIHSDYTSIAVH